MGLEPKTGLEKLLWKLVQSQAAKVDLLENQLALQHVSTPTSSPNQEEIDQSTVEEAGQVKLSEEDQIKSIGVDEDERVDEFPQLVPGDVTFLQSH